MNEIGAWQQKVWGKTRCTHRSKRYALHELEVDKGGFCSYHYHLNRSNVFRVVTGLVRVVWTLGWQIHCTDLGPDNEFEIDAQIAHQFQVLENGLMLEEYYSDFEVEELDIFRLTTGGKVHSLFPLDAVGIIRTNGTIWQGSSDEL